MSFHSFDPAKLVTLPASAVHNHDAFEVEACTACGLDFLPGEIFYTHLDYGHGEQALCEVCYVTYSPNKHENQNANIRTMLILREIRKHAT